MGGAAQAPDYSGQAAKQQQSGFIGQTGPNQNTSWSYDPATGQYTKAQGYGGSLGAANTALQNEAAANVGNAPTGQQARDQAIQASYASSRAQLDPQFAQAGEMNDSQLANEGLDPNSAAARAQQGQFAARKQQAYQGAMNSAIGQGNEAGNQIFQQGQQTLMDPYQQMGALNGLSGQTGTANEAQYLTGAGMQGNFNLTNQQMQNQQIGQLGQAVGGGAAALFGL